MKKHSANHNSTPKRLRKQLVRAERRERGIRDVRPTRAMETVGIVDETKDILTVDHKFLFKGRPPNVGANGRVFRSAGVVISKKYTLLHTKDNKSIRVYRGVPLIIYQMLLNRRRRKEMKRYVW